MEQTSGLYTMDLDQAWLWLWAIAGVDERETIRRVGILLEARV